MIWIYQIPLFFNFGYLIRVEYKKASKMCVRIVRFGIKNDEWSKNLR